MLIKAQMGLDAELDLVPCPLRLGLLLDRDEVDLGVFHGVEFAWAQKRFPDLRPLVIAVNREPHLRAGLLVRADAPAADFADLKGKALACSRRAGPHCGLFLERGCRAHGGGEPAAFFSQVAMPDNGEECLDDLVDGAVQAAVVDEVCLDCYRRRKPARAARLKVLQWSEVFPAGVIAYRRGHVDVAALDRVRQGLLGACRLPLGQQLLTLWKMTGFEPVPDDYAQTLAHIRKFYPGPQESESRESAR
jgi:ABC-type phosphate/phosphonate transport system substrate-binding protein